jgi:hypothetical protein
MATLKASTTQPANSAAVDALLTGLNHPHKAGIQLIRETIRAVDPRIQEEVKWNAPSFKLEDHFATFKLYPPGTIQLVLHRGAKPKSPPRQFVLKGNERLVKWAAPDRCVVSIGSGEVAQENRQAVISLVTQWIKQL